MMRVSWDRVPLCARIRACRSHVAYTRTVPAAAACRRRSDQPIERQGAPAGTALVRRPWRNSSACTSQGHSIARPCRAPAKNRCVTWTGSGARQSRNRSRR
jgi:hypothetical protein